MKAHCLSPLEAHARLGFVGLYRLHAEGTGWPVDLPDIPDLIAVEHS